MTSPTEWIWDWSASTGTDKLVLLAIAREPDVDVDRLVELTGLAESTVHLAISRLEELGALVVDRRPPRRNQYKIWTD